VFAGEPMGLGGSSNATNATLPYGKRTSRILKVPFINRGKLRVCSWAVYQEARIMEPYNSVWPNLSGFAGCEAEGEFHRAVQGGSFDD
jgi:hypothetical protein